MQTEIRADGLDDPNLAYPIQNLEPTSRALKACQKLQIRTIRDFLKFTERDFVSLRNCGKRTYNDLVSRIQRFLSHTQNADRVASLTNAAACSLKDVVDNPRAHRAFATLGIHTLGEFLETPKDRLLGVRGFGERTYWAVSQQIRELSEQVSPAASFLPRQLLEFPLRGLHLDPSLVTALDRLGMATVGDLIAASAEELQSDSSIGPGGVTRLCSALEQLIRTGTNHALEMQDSEECKDFSELITRLLDVLDENQRALVELRMGLTDEPKDLKQIATHLRISEEEAHILEEHSRLTLRNRIPSLLAVLRQEVLTELECQRGFVSNDRFAAGSLLQSARLCDLDNRLPLRLVQICFAHEFYLHGDILSTLTPSEYHRFCKTLRDATIPDQLPVSIADLEQLVSRVTSPVPTGLMLHVLDQCPGLVLTQDPELGQILRGEATNGADRMFMILADVGRPTSAEDILFHYRDRHRHGNLKTLVDQLRQDPRFLEVERETWDLRTKHFDELSAARPEADRIVDFLLTHHGQQSVFDLHIQAELPERTSYMVIDCLRHDPRVRYLGRGVFCQRSEKSTVMEGIRTAIGRALGELVLSQYVGNQPLRKRRAVACVMQYNRALISPAPDRIDLMTNYPFDQERLQRLLELIQTELTAGIGYARDTELLGVINETDLGGSWFTPHLFLDLLRRNMDFELLPGGIVALRDLGLAGWIQHRARECLRHATEAPTAEGLLAEDPELAEFVDCLHDLLKQDPMVQSIDGQRYTLV